jgi:hypothetical protein
VVRSASSNAFEDRALGESPSYLRAMKTRAIGGTVEEMEGTSPRVNCEVLLLLRRVFNTPCLSLSIDLMFSVKQMQMVP